MASPHSQSSVLIFPEKLLIWSIAQWQALILLDQLTNYGTV